MNEQQKRFLLLSLRCAILNLKSWANEIEAVGVAINTNAISDQAALAWIDELGILHWMTPDAEQRDAA